VLTLAGALLAVQVVMGANQVVHAHLLLRLTKSSHATQHSVKSF
jgi:hypothetical protein